jgi:cysteinyl-tRNA synthetase
MLTIYNTLTGTKGPFTPMVAGKVSLYVCGMTVYDYCHLGHARVMVVFDVVTRYLRALGYEVTYVRNITDIDDKIIRRAAEAGEDIGTLTERYIGFMDEDAQALGVQKPDLEPRATRHIEVMTRMIGRLLERGHAYLGKNGDVYYRVASFVEYGKLSGKRPEALRAGARVEVDEAKDDPLDFVLWKRAKPGEPAWASPFGPGRPGWHIECSAMATHCLGDSFDIHGGGQDLQFPHHENEIAQSEGATGQPFARVWMHNGFVQVEEEKMSKSLGNFFTVREVLQRYQPEEVRCFLLASHYRSPLHYSQDNLEHAKQAITRLYLALRDCPDDGQPGRQGRWAFAEVQDEPGRQGCRAFAEVQDEPGRQGSRAFAEVQDEPGRQGGRAFAEVQDEPGRQGGRAFAEVQDEPGRQGCRAFAEVQDEPGRQGGRAFAEVQDEPGRQGGRAFAEVQDEPGRQGSRAFAEVQEDPQEDGFEARFRSAMDDDFNTPEAMAVLFDLAREVNRLQESNRAAAGQLAARLRRLAAVLGLLQSAPERYLRHGSVDDGPADAEVQDWITRRTEARARKDWQEADRIRVRLAAQGVVLEDGPGGTRWRRG